MACGAAGAALLLSAASGCGGSAEHGGPSSSVAGAQQAGSGGATAPGTGGATSPGRGGGGASAGNAQAGGAIVDPDPVETGCPEQEPLPPDLRCDPFTPDSCSPGLGCYPFVEHPTGNGCEQQHYGTTCALVGSGRQGDSCGGDADNCAQGFVCVVGQRAGKRCSALCELGKPNTCPGGLLCSDLDVAGFGVCG